MIGEFLGWSAALVGVVLFAMWRQSERNAQFHASEAERYRALCYKAWELERKLRGQYSQDPADWWKGN